jgi:hypothetical protein
MAFNAVADISPQYEDYPNWWLKAYQQGTVTPLAIATDATGATQLAKVELNSDGWPITNVGSMFIPFIDGDYDLWLFPTAAEADANDTSSALQVADDLNTDPVANLGSAADASLDDLINRFSTVSLMTASTDIDVIKSGNTLATDNYSALGVGGGGKYTVKTAAQAATDGDVIDEIGNFTSGVAGLVIVLQKTTTIKTSQYGVIGASSTVNLQAAITNAANYSAIEFDGDSNLTLDQINITNKTGIKFIGNGAKLQLNKDSNTALFVVTGSDDLEFSGFSFVGTSDTSALYGTGDHKGFDIQTSSFIRILNNSFEKFISQSIFATLLTGGTFTEGVLVSGNVFRDVPLDTLTAQQAAITFSTDGEYCTVDNNWFYRLPSAIRFTDGANGIFSNNKVMQLNGTNWDGALVTTSAAVYAESSTNSGKITVSGNKINHNENDQIAIWLKGDATKPQNAFKVVNNDVLVSGGSNISFCIVLNDAPNSIISGNSIRTKETTTPTDPALKLNDCDNAMVTGNYINGGEYNISADSSLGVILHSNALEGALTNKYKLVSGSTVLPTDRSVALRVSATGSAGTPFDADTWTVSRPVTGRFTVTHNLNSTQYVVSVETDNDAAAPERHYAIVRSANTFDIYVDDGAGAAINEDMLINVTLAKNVTIDFVNNS